MKKRHPPRPTITPLPLPGSDTGQAGTHNLSLPASVERLERGSTYRDAGIICIIPCRGLIHLRVVMSWLPLQRPMNQPFHYYPVWGQEVGVAYNGALEAILGHPQLSKWPYVLTIEEDNTPPWDGILKLIESIEALATPSSDKALHDHPQKYWAAVGGLYWTKGHAGQPMIYGDPTLMPRNFIPQVPLIEKVQECNGLGMGFTLFRLGMFKDPRLVRPFFKTMQEVVPGRGAAAYTQDLYFFEKARALGYRIACDTRVKVGHYEKETDTCW